MSTIVETAATQILSPTGAPPRAEPYLSAALAFSTALSSGAAGLNLPEITVSPIVTPANPEYGAVTKPSLEPISWVAPGLPSAFSGSLSVDDLLPAPFDESPPTLVFETAPQPDFGAVPSAPGINLAFGDPTLDLNLPAAPSLLSISIQPFQGIAIPAAPDDVAEFSLVAPTIREYIPGTQYASGLLTSLQTELQRRITEGGTGLNPDVENAIWDRGREREARTMRDQLDDLDRYEQLGYALPPGMWLDARLKVSTENAYANMGVSREIMIKQAELELEGVRQALQIAQTVEATSIQYANQVEQRSFDAAKYATEAGVAIYNARVQAYGAYVEAYRAKVSIYEAQVRTELAKVEAYKAEVDAEMSKAQINSARVEQFKVLTDAALSAVEVYKAEISAIQTKAQIEQLKVQTFGEQVKAYGTQVNAYTARVEAFRAAIQAEGSKQEAFRSAVQAYGAQVDAGAKVVDARIASFTAQLRAKELEYEGYKAVAQTEGERVRALSASNDAVARMYQAEAGAQASFNEVLGRQWTSATQAAINATQVALEQAKANAELFMTQRSMTTDAAKVGATVAAQLGAAALSANNFSTSYNNSRAVSASKGYTDSDSRSTSESTSESTNYNYNYSASL